MPDQIESSITGPYGEATVLRMGRWWAVRYQRPPGVGGLLRQTTTRGDAMCAAADLVSGRERPSNPKGVPPQGLVKDEPGGLLDQMRDAADAFGSGKTDDQIRDDIRRKLDERDGEEWKRGK